GPVAVPREQGQVELGAADRDDPGDRGPASGRRGDHAQPVEVAAVPDRRSVGEPAAGGQLGALPGLAVEVAADPRLAIAQELVDEPLRMCPAAARRERDGYDESVLGIDRDPETPRPGGPAEDVGRWRHRDRWCHIPTA